ncbi:MAG: hypothetical protein N4A59_14280, partial [Marinifilum sp.]|nr:hypothetical protein [Marinifilum sp.]
INLRINTPLCPLHTSLEKGRTQKAKFGSINQILLNPFIEAAFPFRESADRRKGDTKYPKFYTSR